MNKNMLLVLIHVQQVLIEFKSKENIFLSFFFLKNPDESRIELEEDEIIEPDLKKTAELPVIKALKGNFRSIAGLVFCNYLKFFNRKNSLESVPQKINK